MRGGWFIGDFLPSILRTPDFEVCYKVHKKGEIHGAHIHMIATEYNLLIRGSMTIDEQLIKPGELFILYPGDTADPVFHEDCEVIVVKVPSVIGDKYDV